MGLKHTTEPVEDEDPGLAEGAARTGIVRDGARRAWDEPFFRRTYEPIGEVTADEVRADRAAAYERTKQVAARPERDQGPSWPGPGHAVAPRAPGTDTGLR
ncbi:hypothetical protein [Streptomyces sp. NRRL S-495]|uniref:hypothetical protein n=1 Tax=Streptomyces sp. NRRL S-495 TaxID=1609133 RepID=UPI0005F95837|nr:hypothetical protein [Streptomyces sp. NRRL S-495]KJY31551.1 hypothetical protein VR45_24775 [Streptomyces sp. NRRL S-495]